MMNANGQNPGQGGAVRQDPMNSIIQAAQIQNLPNVDVAQKTAWIQQLNGLKKVVQQSAPNSEQYKQGMQRLMALSHQVKKSFQDWKLRQAGGAGGVPQGQNMAQGQQQGQQQQQQVPQGGQQQQQQQGQPAQPGQQRPAPNPITPQMQANIRSYVDGFTYVYPANAPEGTPQGAQWLENTKKQVSHLLNLQENNKAMLARMNQLCQQRKDANQDIPQEMIKRRDEFQRNYTEAKSKLDKFRESQAAGLKKQQEQNQQRQSQATPQQDGAPFSAGPGGSQQPFQLRLPGQQHNQQSSAQQQQSGTNPSLEAARNANSNLNRSSMSPVTSGQPQQHHLGQAPTSFAQQQPQQQQPNTMANQQQQSQQPQSATGQQRPALSLQQPGGGAINQIPGHQNSPHPGSSGGPQSHQQPAPLSHTQAMAKAERSYSERTPQSASAGGPHSNSFHQQVGNREQQTAPRMPIGKQLPHNLIGTPPAVGVPMARPTLANGVGPMGQPAIAKPPPLALEGGENGTGVLSKKKLDELVRQVTGGPEGMASEGLTPEVEEAMLMLADEFVDNVITAACRLAKLRESSTLDIRDIQLILERNYNIRVPGYASDEIRTIRKFHPTPGWTTKMNAVQAAKVMGGKTDI